MAVNDSFGFNAKHDINSLFSDEYTMLQFLLCVMVRIRNFFWLDTEK